MMTQPNETLAQEAYNKTTNILIHGIEEQKRSVWETQDMALALFHQFLSIGLKLNT